MKEAIVGCVVGFFVAIWATRHQPAPRNQSFKPRLSEMSGFYRRRELLGNRGFGLGFNLLWICPS